MMGPVRTMRGTPLGSRHESAGRTVLGAIPATLDSAIPPRATLLSAAEARWKFAALTLAAGRLNPGHNLVSFLDSGSRNLDIGSV